MLRNYKTTLLAVMILLLLGFSGFASAFFLETPENNLDNDQASTPTRVDLGNGTYVDITVNGNVTTLVFSDGSMIVVNATGDKTTMDIYENPESSMFTRLTLMDNETTSIPATPLAGTQLDASGFIMQEMNGTDVQSTTTFLQHVSDDPALPNATMLTVENSDGNKMEIGNIGKGNESWTYIRHTNVSKPGEFGLIEFYQNTTSTNPCNPCTLTMEDNTNGFNHKATITPSSSKDQNGNVVQSGFNILHNVTTQDGRDLDHQVMGATSNPGSGDGSFLGHYNDTAGTSDSQSVGPNQRPLAGTFPSTAVNDPSVPYDLIEYAVADGMVWYRYEQFEVTLYVDKLIINYYTHDGSYIPIVIYFVVYEIVIMIEQVTIIIYVEVIELVMVVIIYEIIKIEVYISIIVIVIEILQITIIEIIVTIIEITIIHIEINIKIKIKIVVKIIKQIVKKVVKVVFVPLVWIWIIPVFIFVPIFIPIFIPVPTPVPVVIPTYEIDIANQTFNEQTGLMNVSYYVNDQYNNPISGATVSVTIDEGSTSTTYTATEDALRPGYYNLTNIPLKMNAEYQVSASLVGYPLATLVHDVRHTDAPATTVVTTNTTTATVTTTAVVTTTAGNGTATGTSPVPLNPLAVFLAFMAMMVAVPVIRRKKNI